MFPYIPITDQEKKHMLDTIGVTSAEALFEDIPEGLRLNRGLNFDNSMSEYSVKKHMHHLGQKNKTVNDYVSFLGAGTYDHYIPSAVAHITGRSEFYTAYTPYQPEISQGTLQCIFEYQTMICELTGMEATNASMYDGATAAAEAAMIATEGKKDNLIFVSETVHPETLEVIKTYMHYRSVEVKMIPKSEGVTDLKALEAMISKDCSAVIVQSPNYLGNLEDLEAVANLAKDNKALSIASVDPLSLSLLKSPGDCGINIAVGDAQGFGNAMNFGGPHIGFMAVGKKQMRKLPGRIVGETVDSEGKKAYVLTLQAREQHIRREKASSNICSNQAINALAVTVYLSLMGKNGLKKVAEESHKRAVYLRNKLVDTGLFEAPYKAPFFKEFVLKSKVSSKVILEQLKDNGILGGLELGHQYEDLDNSLLICATEKRTKEELDAYIKVVEGLK